MINMIDMPVVRRPPTHRREVNADTKTKQAHAADRERNSQTHAHARAERRTLVREPFTRRLAVNGRWRGDLVCRVHAESRIAQPRFVRLFRRARDVVPRDRLDRSIRELEHDVMLDDALDDLAVKFIARFSVDRVDVCWTARRHRHWGPEVQVAPPDRTNRPRVNANHDLLTDDAFDDDAAIDTPIDGRDGFLARLLRRDPGCRRRVDVVPRDETNRPARVLDRDVIAHEFFDDLAVMHASVFHADALDGCRCRFHGCERRADDFVPLEATKRARDDLHHDVIVRNALDDLAAKHAAVSRVHGVVGVRDDGQERAQQGRRETSSHERAMASRRANRLRRPRDGDFGPVLAAPFVRVTRDRPTARAQDLGDVRGLR